MEEQQEIKPTDSELEILNILWNNGASSVRDVHETLALTKEVGYTTTLKQMQIMLEKGLVSRDTSSKIHVYTAVADQEQTQVQIVQRLIETVFNGSAMKMVMQALGNHKASKEELGLIKDYLEKKKKK
jgi:predicted transcriptional regulator